MKLRQRGTVDEMGRQEIAESFYGVKFLKILKNKIKITGIGCDNG
jgi:hypothetical protein